MKILKHDERRERAAIEYMESYLDDIASRMAIIA